MPSLIKTLTGQAGIVSFGSKHPNKRHCTSVVCLQPVLPSSLHSHDVLLCLSTAELQNILGPKPLYGFCREQALAGFVVLKALLNICYARPVAINPDEQPAIRLADYLVALESMSGRPTKVASS